jgi:fermentation-respiration switch protein FrsA (DUF1100 family)
MQKLSIVKFKMKGPIKIITWIIIGYGLYLCFFFFMSRQIIFPRSHVGYPPGSSSQSIPGIEKTWLDTASGKVEAWFMPPAAQPSKPAPVVIFTHGNAELIDFAPVEHKPFTQLGIGVLLVEYPGYGRSEGRPSQKSITDALIVAYDMLIERKDVDPDKIILYGRSLGGGAACALAAERPVHALILASTFTSVKSMAARYLIPGFIVRDPFDNRTVVQSFSGPILIIHGKNDDLIPYRHGKALHKASKNAKLITYNCGHNDCPPDYTEFWKDISVFLRETGLQIPQSN